MSGRMQITNARIEPENAPLTDLAILVEAILTLGVSRISYPKTLAVSQNVAAGKRARRGQFRIVELVIAVTMVVTLMLMVAFFTRPMRSPYLREVGDLRKFAYNVLNSFAEAGIFERMLENALKGEEGWEETTKMLVVLSLPPGIVFRMEVYLARLLENGTVHLERLDSGYITNLSSNARLTEAEAVHYTHVCNQYSDTVRGKILYIVLVIGYAS